MSFLAWAFAIGGLTVAFPVLFHLIRPTPRGRTQFSSLMFLRHSPPRITRRSRIDNWMLLLLRGLAIILITAAFMRPFVRSASSMIAGDNPGQQLAVLIDSSASMQREGLWQTAIQIARAAVEQSHPGDQIALFTFSDQLQEIVPFSFGSVSDWATQQSLISDQLNHLTSEYRNTHLGEALMSVARIMAELPIQPGAEVRQRILLISDLQTGASLSGLQGEDWPRDIEVELASVRPKRPGNATIRLAGERGMMVVPGTAGPRITVINQADSEMDQFLVCWADADNEPFPDSEVAFYVPPGTSQALAVPLPSSQASNRLLLRGDDCPFDNLRFVTGTLQQKISIDFLGEDRADDRRGALYFLQRVFPETAGRQVTIRTVDSAVDYQFAGGELPQLVIIHRKLADDEVVAIRRFVERGGVAFVVVSTQQVYQGAASLLGSVEPADPGNREQYLMFSEIDFSHPVFASLSGALYNDFSKIRIWNSVPLRASGENAPSPIARFDNGNLAIWENRIGAGSVLGMATSWEPDASQLALSSRFLPMMWGILQMSRGADAPLQHYETGQSLRMPESDDRGWQLKRPDGQTVDIPADDPQLSGSLQLDLPGCYELSNGIRTLSIVANLPIDESLTVPMPPEQLESLGVLTGTAPDEEKQMRDLAKISEIQMEGRQRIWKWLILTVLVLLVVETVLALQHSVPNTAIGVTSR